MQLPPNALTSLLTRRAPWLAVLAAYGLFAQEIVRTSLADWTGMDNLLVVQAARNLYDGASPYVSERFLYPPASVPFGLLEAPFSDLTLVRVFPYLVGLMLSVGWWAVLRLFDVELRSWLGVLGVAASALFNPAVSVAELGSWTAPVACLMAVALLLMGRGRWLAAGVVIGVSIAIKPMLMPIGLIFLLTRRWGGFAAAAGIPVALCAIVLPLLPQPELFFTKTVPFLLSGQDGFARPYDSSLMAILPRLGIEGSLVTVVRLGVLIGSIAVAVLRWRRGGDERVRLVETSAILMVGIFLVMTPAFGHYPMIVVPGLVAAVVVAESVARSVWFWISLVPLTQGFDFPYIDFWNDDHGMQRQAFKPFFWMTVLLALLVVRTVRDRVDAGPRTPAGAGDLTAGLPRPRVSAERLSAADRPQTGHVESAAAEPAGEPEPIGDGSPVR